jgi:large subunit ribosomal protein L3
MKGLLGKKIGMTQIFTEEDKLVPVTVIEANECVVTQVKTPDRDGYSAIQIGYGEMKEKSVGKPMKGHFDKNKVKYKKHLAEIRVAQDHDFKVGQEIKADLFEVGEKADITGVSKGKGYAGVIKRWKFGGGPGGHGSHFHRAPGAIGACASPSRVFKGRKLPGQMGNKQVTVQGLEIAGIDADQNLIMIKGSIPGSTNGIVILKESVKKSKKAKKKQ